ncbi:MAG: UDP-N-acetylmuramate--L-alanine ligase [Bacteroidota bacterium]|nr:UDP-N-acetylmuramate--L-alanine ligase [Bacteroidota bacterium]
MKDYTNISRIYFIGIGGIGMSALAKYYLSKNAIVSGYDKTATPLTRQMESDGIKIHYEDSLELLDKDAQLVVYTPAVPKDHNEFNYYLNNNYEVIKRSALLGEITKSTFNICIAGTHGKTTISTMVAHILTDSGFGCNAFLGGISVNYNTNFWSSNNNVAVVEADEYDRSFLKLSPDVALISAMDADHLDIYGTKENMEKAFIDFSGRLKNDGLLLTNYALNSYPFSAHNHIRYSLKNNNADAFADNINISDGGYEFDVVTEGWSMKNIRLNMGGMHNVENAVAAITIAHHLNIEESKIKKAVGNFQGVKRRFEYIISPGKGERDSSQNDLIFIDDYAHHPQELNALISGAKNLFGDRKCTIIFQPHLFSRTKDFVHEFAESLDNADEVLILPIYPARELPIEGVTSNMIVQFMKNKNVRVVSKEDVMDFVQNIFVKIKDHEPAKLLITAGAGDIDKLVQTIKEILLNKF